MWVISCEQTGESREDWRVSSAEDARDLVADLNDEREDRSETFIWRFEP